MENKVKINGCWTFTYEFVKQAFADRGCELLTDHYINSKQKLSYKCVCGETSVMEFRNFKSGKGCKKCGRNKCAETMKKKYNGQMYCQTDAFKQQREATNIEKYGCSSPMQNEVIKKNRRDTNLAKYGVEHVAQVESVKNKIRTTMKEKYGFEYVMQCPEFKKKYDQTILDRYGVPNMAHLSNCCSKESQNLFWSIYNNLPETFKEKSYFADLNNEFVIQYEKSFYKYDFVNSKSKTCIEYNGSNFHPQDFQNEDDTGWCAFHPNLSVKEARQYEQAKFHALERRGYNILVVWDYEFKRNLEPTLSKCMEFVLA